MAIRTNDLKQFHNKTFRVNKVYNDYRSGCVETNWKFIFRTFKYFPKVEEEVLIKWLRQDGSKLTKEMEISLGRELREQVWGDGGFNFHRITDKLDKDFWKAWPKVFDLEIETENSLDVFRYHDKRTNTDVVENGNIINITGVSAGKIKNMLRGIMDEDNGEIVPMIKGKDKAGNEAMVEEYDWEDKMKDVLEGRFIKMKVSGEWMDTKYIFQPGKTFETKQVEQEWWADVTF